MERKTIEPFIRIIRDTSPYGTRADVDVYIDGRKVGVVDFNTKKDFLVSEGVHEVYVRMQSLRSEPISIVTEASPNKMLAMKAYRVKPPGLNPLNFVLRKIFGDAELELVKVADDRP